MDGSGSSDRRPSEATIQRIHDRYLIEVVEGLGLCPFARHSREQGRVHRPVFWADGDAPGPDECARRLGAIVTEHADAEIVLLTFVLPPNHVWNDPARFERFCRTVKDGYDALGHARFYMVSFHPRLGEPIVRSGREINADNLVPLIRRTPDPVIQCVRAEVLDAARSQAQAQAQAKLTRSMDGVDPEIRTMILHSVSADSELSADIAQQNHAAIGQGAGRAGFEDIIADILRERDEAYARETGEPT